MNEAAPFDDAYIDSLNAFGEAEWPAWRRAKPSTPQQFVFDGQASSDPPRMLVKGLVPADGICFLGGQSGTGKTFIEVALATCLASGIEFFGRKIKERVGCVILAAEGAGGLQRRISAAKSALDIDRPLPVAWRSVTENLLDPGSLRMSIEALRKLDQQFRDEHGVRLGAIFVDTVGAAFGLEDENDAAKVNAAMRVLRQISDALGAVIIPVHHYGKAATTGLRGSSAFRGAADVVISVLAERDETTGESSSRSICLAKARDGEEGPIAAFELRFVHLGFDEDGEPFGSCVVDLGAGPAAKKKEPASKMSKCARVALKALHEATEKFGVIPSASNYIPANVKAVTVSQWRECAYRRGISESDELRARQIAFSRGHESLVAMGKVGICDPYAWAA
jgi:hypothetical protein